MIKNKIIIMTNEWFTNEKYRLFMVDRYIKAGFEIEIWNTNKIMFSEDNIPPHPQDEYMGDITVVNFENRKTLKRALKVNKKESLFIVYYPITEPLEELCKKHVKYVTIEIDAYPVSYHEKNIEAWNDEKRTSIRIREILHFRSFLRNLVIKKNPPLQCFFATVADYFPLYRSWKREIINFVHHIDYDKYLLDTRKDDVGEEYILFIDEATGIHPEEIYKKEIYRNEDFIKKYRCSMIRLFEKLENNYGLRTIIAAHPKAEYTGDEFGNREIIQFQSYELIKKAALIIIQYSTMVDIAALYKKRVLFVTIDEFASKENCMVYQRVFDMVPFNIYHDDNPENFVWMDEKKYDMFIDNYVIGAEKTDLYTDAVIKWIREYGIK